MIEGLRSQYRITAQRAEDNNDPRGTTVLEGENFSDLVALAESQRYPRIIAGEERRVTPWTPITNYTFAKESD